MRFFLTEEGDNEYLTYTKIVELARLYRLSGVKTGLSSRVSLLLQPGKLTAIFLKSEFTIGFRDPENLSWNLLKIQYISYLAAPWAHKGPVHYFSIRTEDEWETAIVDL